MLDLEEFHAAIAMAQLPYLSVATACFAIASPQQPAPPPQPAAVSRTHLEQRYVEAAVKGKVADALETVRTAPDGQKHYTLRDMALLCGGLVQHGVYTESELADLLREAIAPRADDLRQAEATIAWGLQHGQQQPIAIEPPAPRRNGYTNSNGHHAHPLRDTVPLRQPPDAVRSYGRLLSSDAVLALPPVRWLIDQVLPDSDLVVLYGLPGTGKSLLALDIACTVSQVAPVVYVAAEALPTHTSRLATWQAHTGRSTPDLFWWDRAVNMLDPFSVEMFLSAVEHLQPALIVFDTLAMCMPGVEENGNADMSRAVGQLMHICAQTGATVLPVHHSDKAGLTPRGHSALIGAAASIIKVTNDDGLITFRSEKQRNGKPFETRLFHLVEKPEVAGVVLLPTSKVAQRDSPLNERALLVLEELCEPIHEGRLHQAMILLGHQPRLLAI